MNEQRRSRLPQLWLEQLRLGELSVDRQRALEKEFGQAEIQRALAELERLEAGEQLPRLPAVAQSRQRHPERLVGPALLAGGFVSAAVAALVMGPWRLPTSSMPSAIADAGVAEVREVGVRLKGEGPGLRVFRKTDGGVERLQSGAWADAGDVLQLGYAVDRQGYGLIASVDGRGAVTLHFPEEPSGAQQLVPGENLLAQGYQLDDSPHFEWFVFVSDRQPLDVEAWTAALAAAVRAKPGEPPAIAETAAPGERLQIRTLLVRK